MEGMNDLVADHPALVVALFSTLWTILAALWAALRWFVAREFKKVEDHEARQDKAIKGIEDRLDEYDVSFAVSKESFSGFMKKLDDHIVKEDQTVKKIDAIQQQVATNTGVLHTIERLLRNGTSRRR